MHGKNAAPQTGERVNCRPSLRTGSAYYPCALPVATARLPKGRPTALWPCGPLNSHFSWVLPPSTALHHSFLCRYLPLYIPSPTLTSEVGPLNTARGLGEHCKWGVGRSHSVNQIRCILPFKSDICWHQYMNPIFHMNRSPTVY